MGIDWGNIGLLGIGLVALIIAIAKELLYLPVSVEQWKSEIAQWKHRWEEMRDDRDYWRAKAHRHQEQADEATRLQSDRLECDDV